MNASLRKDWTLDRPHIYLSGSGQCVPKLKHYGKKTRRNAYRQCLRRQVGPSRYPPPKQCGQPTGSSTGRYKRPPMLPIRTMTSSFLHSLLIVNGSSLKPELLGASVSSPTICRSEFPHTPFCRGQHLHSRAAGPHLFPHRSCLPPPH